LVNAGRGEGCRLIRPLQDERVRSRPFLCCILKESRFIQHETIPRILVRNEDHVETGHLNQVPGAAHQSLRPVSDCKYRHLRVVTRA
jgi:hypothetical protein